MKFILNKKQVFGGGGLYYSNTIAIVSILGCCEEVCAEYKDVSEIINLFNNISWRIIANNKIVDADESNWIAQEKYNESIIKVIAQAVADCVTDKNEFANKGANDVITFAVEAKDYSAENWNAVVLWNYIHVLKWDYLHNKTRSKDEIFKDVKSRICDNYPTEGVVDLAGKVNQAIDDIKEYDRELSLKEEMHKFYSIANNTSGKTLDEIIQRDIMISPIGNWDVSGERFFGRKEYRQGKELAYIYFTNYNQSMLTPPKRFTPIKMKMDNKLYYINCYVCNIGLTCFGNDMRIDTISKTKPLPEGISAEYWKNIVFDASIVNKLKDNLRKIFEGIDMPIR